MNVSGEVEIYCQDAVLNERENREQMVSPTTASQQLCVRPSSWRGQVRLPSSMQAQAQESTE